MNRIHHYIQHTSKNADDGKYYYKIIPESELRYYENVDEHDAIYIAGSVSNDDDTNIV